MPRKLVYLKMALPLALLLAFVSAAGNLAFGQLTNNKTYSSNATSGSNSPTPHSPPILTPLSTLGGLWNQLTRQENDPSSTDPSSVRVNQRIQARPGGTPQSNTNQSTPANAVTVPISDETEKAIAEVRSRLGNSGSRFSDLISAEDEARLFSEALAQVRQEQQTPAAPQTPAVPSPPHAPQAPSHSVPPHNVLIPPNNPLPGPAWQSPAWGQPAPSNQPNPGAHPANPQLHWAPGQPIPPQPSPWPSPNQSGPQPQPPMPVAGPRPAWGNWNNPGQRPGQPFQLKTVLSPQETEQAAMRRIARQVDALAEQLENLKRYSEADSLRRSAQQFREAVR